MLEESLADWGEAVELSAAGASGKVDKSVLAIGRGASVLGDAVLAGVFLWVTTAEVEAAEPTPLEVVEWTMKKPKQKTATNNSGAPIIILRTSSFCPMCRVVWSTNAPCLLMIIKV